MQKLKLHGFNNLTKSLSFNIYDICYAKTPEAQQQYLEYIDEAYSASRITELMNQVTETIGAHILNIAYQDYEPQGASVTMLIAEGPVMLPTKTITPDAVVGHLDKSHIAVHTYPEMHPDNEHGICTFRADIDVSTCGLISPLKALNLLIDSFECDIATVDYRTRGFTRDIYGNKLYTDTPINSIQNFFTEDVRHCYEMIDVNIYQENIFHTKMLLKEFDLDNYLFGTTTKELSNDDEQLIRSRIKREMLEIFYGRNMADVPIDGRY
ncbi:adenosylmethionine decarboxylase [Piscirickettsia litoralis]|uniref:S-adenosylmethionine decarboxylase proenzyme n=1 Tax=Piscirickettsia litoralis TaxID=1891921 RepID=A0ABX3A0Z8_9GAMM|nr:adenosylmethionine decarboxylase [Piscirickettsia litoralis]ODN42536.1 S-adenosylmethionine decarboxylase [Piscirickettsia litoralis]